MTNHLDTWRTKSTADAEAKGADLSETIRLVRRFELMLRAPDALHLAIARRLGAALATLDRRLASAASGLGVVLADIPGR